MTRTVENDDLKPCPFCGGEELVRKINCSHTFYWIECDNCGCSVDGGNSKEIAIEAWNTRAALTAPIPQAVSDDMQSVKNYLEHARQLLNEDEWQNADGLIANALARLQSAPQPVDFSNGVHQKSYLLGVMDGREGKGIETVDVETFANEIVDVMRPYKLCDRHVNHTAATLIAKHIAQTYDLVKKVK